MYIYNLGSKGQTLLYCFTLKIADRLTFMEHEEPVYICGQRMFVFSCKVRPLSWRAGGGAFICQKSRKCGYIFYSVSQCHVGLVGDVPKRVHPHRATLSLVNNGAVVMRPSLCCVGSVVPVCQPACLCGAPTPSSGGGISSCGFFLFVFFFVV